MDLVQDYSSDDNKEDAPITVAPAANSEGHGNSQNKQQSVEQNAHQGRIRSFPHQEGNYATHVYITVAVPDDLREPMHSLLSAIKQALPCLEPVLASDAAKSKESLVQPWYHVSLSRVVPIRYHEIDPLLLSLKEALACTQRRDISFGEPEVFENDDNTRTFLALGIGRGRDEVCKVIKRVDRAFRDHGLRQFYSRPRPHASVMWMLGSASGRLQAMLDSTLSSVSHDLEHLMQHTFALEEISCKIGQRVTTVWCKHAKQGA